MSRIFQIIACLLLSINLSAQTEWIPEKYYGISPEHKQAVFFEGFDDNRNSWDLGVQEGSWTEKILDGNLIFQSMEDQAKEDFIRVEFDPRNDFEIEARIKLTEGNPGVAHGLQWGKAELNQYDFFITGSGEFTIDKFSGEFFDYVPFTKSESIRKNDYNKLTIRKVNNTYYFFINEVMVHTMLYKPFFGDNIGFQVGDNSTIMVDYLRASRIQEMEVEVPADYSIRGAKYYALLIGISEYQYPDLNDLEHPVRDAVTMHDILVERYNFTEDNVRLLENPTREEMISTLDALSASITEQDNLLIFYAGHGFWNEDTKVGYWLPTDANLNNTANWFRNSTLRDYIGSIHSKHTLLIADACFSGSIFKARSAFNDASDAIEKLYNLPSRKAMTSGTLKEVPDESVFVQYLIKRLEENNEKYLSAEQLFSSMRTAVLNNSPNVPQFGEIKDTGDEGGDFIFVKKNGNTQRTSYVRFR